MMPYASEKAEGVHPPEAFRGKKAAVRNTVGFMGLFVVVVSVLACGQYWFVRFIDPYGEWGTGRFPRVVMDSRRDKMQMFRRASVGPHVSGVLLGSSRSMLLRPSVLSDALGQPVFNFAVDNAHVEDYLAIYRWTTRQGAPLRLLIIGLDVVAMHPDDVPDHMFQRIDELKTQLEEPSSGRTGPFHAAFFETLDRLKRPFTAEYLKDSLKSVA